MAHAASSRTAMNTLNRFYTPRAKLSVFELFLLSAPTKAVDAFFARWTPDLVVRLRQLSSSMLLATEAYSSRRWNARTFLSHWFEEPSEFLITLEDCDGVISGSEAQQFFGRCEFRGHDLDIYVPLHGLLDMGRYLKLAGFAYQPTTNRHPLFDVAALMFSSHVGQVPASLRHGGPHKPAAFGAFNFVRFPGVLGPQGRHIQIIAVSDDPIHFIINSFHSTGVMNYLTANHAVCLFPNTTFVERKTLVCQDTTRNSLVHRSWMKKYRKRGFTVITAGDVLPPSPELHEWRRRVGDSFTWVIPFQASSLPIIESEDSGPGPIYKVAFEVLPYTSGVAAPGAALRVGPRFVYSSMAMIANPAVEFGAHYFSSEVAAAFLEYFADDDDPPTDTDESEEELATDDEDAAAANLAGEDFQPEGSTSEDEENEVAGNHGSEVAEMTDSEDGVVEAGDAEAGDAEDGIVEADDAEDGVVEAGDAEAGLADAGDVEGEVVEAGNGDEHEEEQEQEIEEGEIVEEMELEEGEIVE
ncbi:uncharacterized protein TRAVEDRAFT_17657 [Trametes versicolor FP-101664 SS1]|uniref:uncharacterized protein n=1 Tax=Trametes versicolor (strain FP-101664) TaxID=717944 RepID=UPI000462352A|nr:uncharacterized protein TRAVEDRAFT_17657 [Trametes versicolor FP-101664 SS1]EIW63230.1 hypothetical protein TRAVEDRAFT_17657 [Trametes versicolor FP-101664 SS1]